MHVLDEETYKTLRETLYMIRAAWVVSENSTLVDMILRLANDNADGIMEILDQQKEVE